MLERFGNPFYSAELSKANTTKFIWYDFIDYKFTIVCIVTASSRSVCSVEGDIENETFFDQYR